MDTQTLTLADFLLARIAEDETAAFGRSQEGYTTAPVGDAIGVTVGGQRLRDECEAKRRIVELHHRIPVLSGPGYGTPEVMGSGGCVTCDSTHGEQEDEVYLSLDGGACATLRALALPHADHPDYREEWRA
jgi:hypothetical protein